MRRTVLSEKQRAVALLVALGQLTYQEIARQVGLHYNSITNYLKDERVQALVSEFQQNIQHQLEDMTRESVYRKDGPLLVRAVDKLEEMLASKSQKRQLGVIKLLLEYGALPGIVQHDQPQGPQGKRPSRIRLDPKLQARLRVTES